MFIAGDAKACLGVWWNWDLVRDVKSAYSWRPRTVRQERLTWVLHQAAGGAPNRLLDASCLI
jgi:hypothetical protein